MTKEEIISYNENCLKFLGRNLSEFTITYTEERTNIEDYREATIDDMEYHSDWNRIMLIKEKIRELGFRLGVLSGESITISIFENSLGQFETIKSECICEVLGTNEKEALVEAIRLFFNYYYRIDQISKRYALQCHRETNHKYDGKDYSVHLYMVVEVALKYIHLIDEHERETVLAACWLHDTIEDTRTTWNDLKKVTNTEVADIVYALTNEKGKTRAERANDKYYEGIRNTKHGIFVKLCDRIANYDYSIMVNSSMAEKYKSEMNNFIEKLYDEKYKEMFFYLKKYEVL